MRTNVRIAAAALAGLAGMALLQGFVPPADSPELVVIDGATVAWRAAGEFLRDGRPVNGPVVTLAADRPFEIMRRQVTRGEYARCADAGACRPLDGAGAADLPATGVSHDDAAAYAAWLSAATGDAWRLPTDAEWALAAGSRWIDDAWTEVSDPANPARRWLAAYEAMAAERVDEDPAVRPAGWFGANEHGLLDLSGNVWEWTSTCATRTAETAGGPPVVTETCGVRVAEGRHRAYMSVFFRDPKAGACSVGVPPVHLGMRLVREDGGVLAGARAFLGV